MQLFLLILSLHSAGIILQARRAVIYSLGDINSWITSFETFKAQHRVSVLSGCVLADYGSKKIHPAFHPC